MSEATKPEPQDVGPSEVEVAGYLRDHPDFFDRNEEVLEALDIHHASGSAVSLIERQVRVLQDKNHKLNNQLQQLLENARLNESRVMNLNSLAKRLVCAADLKTMMQALRECLARDFQIDEIFIAINNGVGINAPGIESISENEPLKLAFSDELELGSGKCGPLSQSQNDLIFSKTRPMKSAAFVPLKEPLKGLLVLASGDDKRFTTDMGTEFVTLIADWVATAVIQHTGAEPG